MRKQSYTFNFLSLQLDLHIAVLYSSTVQYVPVGRLPILSILVLPHFARKRICIRGGEWWGGGTLPEQKRLKSREPLGVTAAPPRQTNNLFFYLFFIIYEPPSRLPLISADRQP